MPIAVAHLTDEYAGSEASLPATFISLGQEDIIILFERSRQIETRPCLNFQVAESRLAMSRRLGIIKRGEIKAECEKGAKFIFKLPVIGTQKL